MTDCGSAGRTLQLGYTESQGLPELRAEIATLYGEVDAEQVIVAAPEEAIFLTMHALLAPGRSRDLHLPRLPVAVRAGPEHRVRGGPLGAATRTDGMALRPGRARGAAAPRHQARGLELPSQPDRRAALGRGLPPDGRRRRRAQEPGCSPTRCTGSSSPRAESRLPAAVDLYERARLPGRHVQGVRAGRAAHRLGGSAGRLACSSGSRA